MVLSKCECFSYVIKYKENIFFYQNVSFTENVYTAKQINISHEQSREQNKKTHTQNPSNPESSLGITNKSSLIHWNNQFHNSLQAMIDL